jgi:hypothetical protein
VICLIAGVNSLLAQTKSSWVVKYDESGLGPEEVDWTQVLYNDYSVDGAKRDFDGDFVILIMRKDRQLSSDVAFPLHCVNGFDPELLRVFAWEYHGDNQRLRIFQGNDLVYQSDYWKQTMFFIIDLSADNTLDELKTQLQVEECEEWKESVGYRVYENVSLGFIDESQSESRSSYEEQICWRIKSAIDLLNREAEKRSDRLLEVGALERSSGPTRNGRIMVGVGKSLIESYSLENHMKTRSMAGRISFEFTAAKRVKGSMSSLGIEVTPCDMVFETSWTPSEQSMPWNEGGVEGGVFFVENNGVKERIALNFLAVSGLWFKPVTIPEIDESNLILRFGMPLMKGQYSQLMEGEFSYSATIPGVESRIRNVESLGLVDAVQVDSNWQTEFGYNGWLAGASLQMINGLGDDYSYYLSTGMELHRWNISDSSMPVPSTSPTEYSSAMAGRSMGLVNLRVSAGIIFGR